MPFKSKAQAKYMFSQRPEMAKEWASVTPSIEALPSKVKKNANKRKAKKSKKVPRKRHTNIPTRGQRR